MTNPQNASIYIHVPFCTRKCDYCHFYVIPDKKSHHEIYMEALKQEWEIRRATFGSNRLVSIYFGGGTPSLLSPDAIEEILSWLPISDDCEISLEANPESVTLETMRAFAKAGINRVSLGIQSFDDDLLKRLSRTHSAQHARQAILNVKKSGIDNITIDLMYDLPGQSLEQWRNTLAEVNDLPITHLSLYNLTIEPHTVFYKYRQKLMPLIPAPETSRIMYCDAVERLDDMGLKQYEISAFAKQDKMSRHNVGYWTGRPFLGLGPSAFSYWDNRRFRNICNFNKWADHCSKGENPADFEELLLPDARKRELLTIRLRLSEGIDLNDFEPLEIDTSETIQKYLQLSFLETTGSKVRLTKDGQLFYDSIATDLV